MFGTTITVNSLADSASPGAGMIFLGSPDGYGMGTFRWGSGAESSLVLTNRQIVLGSGSGVYGGTISNDNTTAANNITIHSDLIVGSGSGSARQLILAGVNSGANTFAGSIGNGIDTLADVTAAVTKSGTGNWRISNANNSFTGAITFSPTGNAGTLSYASAAGTNPINFNQTNGSATLDFTGDAPLAMSGLITASALTTGTITLSASGTTPEAAIHYSNPNSLTSVATSNSVRKLVLAGGNTGENTFGGAFTNNIGSSNAATLTKNGTGTWILTGANAHTGTTTITAGKLFINGDQSSASGNVSVAANATLGGTGTLGGNTTIATGGKLEFELSTPAASHDKLELATGRILTFSGASELTITSSGGASPGTYIILTAPGGINGNDPAMFNFPAGWEATVSKAGNDLMLNVISTGSASSPYEIWAGGEAFDADANGDGIANGLAWLLGAANPIINANGLLPAASQNSGGLVLTFNSLNAANRGSAVLSLQYSMDLGATDPWENHTVVVPDASGTVGGVVFVVTPNGDLNQVQATIPASAADSSGKLFARLEGESQEP